jgi:hypothetical protein
MWVAMVPVLSTVNWLRRAGLPACLTLLALSPGPLGGCTKVVEQPVLDPGPPPPEPPKKQRRFPPPPPAWPSSRPAAEAPTAPAPKPPEPAVETLNGDPQGLKREDLQNALDGAMDRFSGCVDGTGTTRVALSFDADPAGSAQNVKVSGGGATAEKCVASVVTGLPLPKFSGKAVPVHFPITVQRTVTQPAPREPNQNTNRAAARPTPPPLMFVKP